MKKIAIDLDGVVFNSEDLFRVYSEIFDIEKHGEDMVIDNTERTFQKRYNWTPEEMKEFYYSCAEKIVKESDFMPGVDIILNRLSKEYELIAVTARSDSETIITKERFKEIGFENIKIFNNEHHKIDRFLKEDVSYVIDDDPIICADAADNNICALYLKNNAAKVSDHKGVVNVNNWGEIYKYFMLKSK